MQFHRAKSQFPPEPQFTSQAGPQAASSADLQAWLSRIESLLLELSATSRKEFYTVEELARLVDRSAYTIRRWIKEGHLRAIRIIGGGARGRLSIPHDEVRKLTAVSREVARS